jgi:dTDP-4-dehydrorhamnose reductase
MTILVTGALGQVGFELQRALAPLAEVTAVDVADCNLADAHALRALVRRVQPVLIVNPAAYTAVDKAESDRELAYAVNAAAPRVLGEEAAALGIPVVHYSTDYVFDGSGSRPWSESDTPNPLNVYGASKWAGEQALAEANPRHLILRTSWVVGAHGANFARTMLRLAAERERLTVVADQVGAPTPAALLADLTAQLASEMLGEGEGEGDGAGEGGATSNAFPWGTYHVAAAGETTWCDYARFVIAEAIAAGKALKAHPESVQPIATADYPTPARRPLNSRLDTRRFRDTFGLRLPPWEEGLRHTLRQIL